MLESYHDVSFLLKLTEMATWLIIKMDTTTTIFLVVTVNYWSMSLEKGRRTDFTMSHKHLRLLVYLTMTDG